MQVQSQLLFKYLLLFPTIVFVIFAIKMVNINIALAIRSAYDQR